MGFPHQFDPEHSGFTAPGLLSSPFAGSCIATDPPTIFGHRRNPAEAVPDRPWVPSIATFRNPFLRCPKESVSWKELPVSGVFPPKHQPAIGFFRLTPAA
jgi:hypothetical protein